MRILMVTPYPPLRDGIASYAVQMVRQLQDDGHEVEVLSPAPSAAHHHLDFLSGPRGGLALARRARNYDRLIVQWHALFFYARKDPGHRIAVDLALQAAFRAAPSVEVWVHEFEYHDLAGDSVRARVGRALWRSVDCVYFHSDAERAEFLEVTGVDPAHTVVAEHGAAFRTYTSATKEEARRSLGLPPTAKVFLAIGFIQRHKGFDRAVDAFAGLGAHGAELHLVGSTRVDEPDFVAYVDELDSLCAATPGAELHLGYVSDELFDRWIVASDVVVLPYREIWSSGVFERAALYDRPVIATRVGGLEHQAGGRGATLVDDDAQLRAAMWKAAGVAPSEAETAGGPLPADADWPEGGDDLWEQVQAAVVERAGVHRARSAARPVTGDGSTPAVLGDPVDKVRRLGPAPRPITTSNRLGASLVKRAISRLTSWQLEPLAQHVDALRQGVIDALDEPASSNAARDGGRSRGAPPAAAP